jgi:hypothetical protein
MSWAEAFDLRALEQKFTEMEERLLKLEQVIKQMKADQEQQVYEQMAPLGTFSPRNYRSVGW